MSFKTLMSRKLILLIRFWDCEKSLQTTWPEAAEIISIVRKFWCWLLIFKVLTTHPICAAVKLSRTLEFLINSRRAARCSGWPSGRKHNETAYIIALRGCGNGQNYTRRNTSGERAAGDTDWPPRLDRISRRIDQIAPPAGRHGQGRVPTDRRPCERSSRAW